MTHVCSNYLMIEIFPNDVGEELVSVKQVPDKMSRYVILN